MTEIKAGYLTKCGGKVKSWKKRWIILRSNGFLSYYEKKGGTEKGSIDVINSGRLGYASSIDSADQLPSGTSTDTAFAIVTKERTYTFCADSAAECKDWISCLTRVKSNDGDGGVYQGYPTPTNPNQPQELPPQQQAGPLPPKDQPPAYPYPVGAYNGPAAMPQAQQPVGGPPMPQPMPQQPVGGPPMPRPQTQPPPYTPAAPPPAAPYPQPGYYQQPYRQPYQQPYRQPYQQPYRQPYQQPYRQPYQQPYRQPYYPTKQPQYYPQQRPPYRPPPARQQQSSNTTVVAGGMVISIGNNQQQGAGGQQSASNVSITR